MEETTKETKKQKRSKQVLLTVSQGLLCRFDTLCKQRHMGRSEYIRAIMRQEVEAQERRGLGGRPSIQLAPDKIDI